MPLSQIMRFPADSIEREVYDQVYPRFCEYIAPRLLQEIIEAVVETIGPPEIKEELETEQEMNSIYRGALDNALHDIEGLFDELKKMEETLKTLQASLQSTLNEESDGSG